MLAILSAECNVYNRSTSSKLFIDTARPKKRCLMSHSSSPVAWPCAVAVPGVARSDTTFNTLEVISQMIFSANYLTGAKLVFLTNYLADISMSNITYNTKT